MGPVLPGTHDPVQLTNDGIVTADGLRTLRREPELSLYKDGAMRAIQWFCVKRRKRFLGYEIQDVDLVQAATAIDGDIGLCPVGGGNNLMRIAADGGAGDHFEGGGADDLQGVART